MSQRVRRLVLLVLAGSAACSAGCGLPPTRVGFIEGLAKENRTIARSARAFHAAIIPLRDGAPANPTEVRSTYDAMVKTVQTVRSDMDGQLLPPSSNSAKDLLAAYKTYLDAEKDILNNEMKAIVDEVELPTDAGGNPTVNDRWAVISGLLDQVKAKEGAAFNTLTQAQKSYTDEHNYEPLGLSEYAAAQKKK